MSAIDTHVHSFPDVVARKLDDLALVEHARAAGMRGVLLKSHVFSTAERAWLLSRIYSDFKTFGGITLNDTVGGLNPAAVQAALKLGGRADMDAHALGCESPSRLGGNGSITVLDRGRLRPEAIEIVRLIAAHDAILATGHLSPAESEALTDAALEIGVSRINVTHPEWPVTAMPIAVQRRLAETGRVYLERCFVATQSGAPAPIKFASLVEQIRATPIEQNIVASDFGMPQYGTPVEGMRMFIEQLLATGFAERDVRAMCQTNPARLLKLEAA